MRKIMMYLLTITMFLLCSAHDKFAKTRDCETQHSEGSFFVPIFRPCTGDPEIFLTINFKMTVKQCTAEDGRVTSKVHVRYHGTGIGTTTGNEYVLNAQEKDLTVVTEGCEFSMTQTFRQELISKGPLPNVRLLNTSTFTVDSNCESNFTQSSEVICQD